MRVTRVIAAAVIVAILAVPVFAANTWGTDMSDLWFNPAESGWGANVAHQGEVIFLTLFVYGSDGSVKWYVAPQMTSPGGNGELIFSGALYQTQGPYFGAGFFNPASVGVRQVGTATLDFPFVSSGTLSYSVDGVFVSKQVQRQTFRTNSLSGSYIGAAIGTDSGCRNFNGPFGSASTLNVTQTGSSVTVFLNFISGAGSCTFSGTYSQVGRMGQYGGTISCSNGAFGSFNAFEIEAGRTGFFARYTADYGGGCTEEGRIGGLKQ